MTEQRFAVGLSTTPENHRRDPWSFGAWLRAAETERPLAGEAKDYEAYYLAEAPAPRYESHPHAPLSAS